MVAIPDVYKLQFSVLVNKLFSSKWLIEKVAEAANVEFDEFLSLPYKEKCDKFSQFNWKEDRVDEFLGSFLHKNESYVALWNVCKIVFALSHGQTAV